MPRHCSAVGCKSRDTKDARLAGVTFHRLPKKGNPRREAWILNSCRKGPGGKGLWEPRSDFVYFCSKHFTSDSFELAGVSGYRRLKEDAVPTVVEPRSCLQKSSKRKGKQRKKDVERQTSPATRADDEPSESSQTPIKEPGQSVSEGEGIASTNLNNQEQANEQAFPKYKLASDQPADITADPPSPSCYMRRLPPPAGFYVAKEHSYALVYPLVWRRSYEKAIDSLQKALRLLSAARRRENRLRFTLLRLRESRFKQTLSQIQDQTRESQGRAGQVAVSESLKVVRSDLEESEVDSTMENMELFQEEEGWRRPGQVVKQKAGAEDEEGYCFYCGRGREDGDQGRTWKRINKSRTVKESKGFSGIEAKQCRFYSCDSEDQTKDVSAEQLTHLQPQPEMLLEAHTLSGPGAMPVSPLQLSQLQFLQHRPHHTDVTTTQTGMTQAEEGGMCGLFLVPVSSEKKESSVISAESAIQNINTQTLLVAGDELHHRDNLNVETDLMDLRNCGLIDNHNSLQSSVRDAVAGADVKQRLKEHLEGFQLQLSNEFIE